MVGRYYDTRISPGQKTIRQNVIDGHVIVLVVSFSLLRSLWALSTTARARLPLRRRITVGLGSVSARHWVPEEIRMSRIGFARVRRRNRYLPIIIRTHVRRPPNIHLTAPEVFPAKTWVIVRSLPRCCRIFDVSLGRGEEGDESVVTEGWQYN